MSDRSFNDAWRELEEKVGMPLSEVPIIHHHDNCGLAWIDACTCDPDGQCNLPQSGSCECGTPTDEQKRQWGYTPEGHRLP